MRKYKITDIGMQVLGLPEWTTLTVYSGQGSPIPAMAWQIIPND